MRQVFNNIKRFTMKFTSTTLVLVLFASFLTACGGGESGPPADVYKTTCLPTKAAFSQLYPGMTYSQVVSIFGCEGSLASDITESGVRMQNYEWGDINAKQPGMVKAYVPFENARLVARADKKPIGAGLL